MPALKDAAAGLADPHRPLDVPLLGRPDWWALWYRALGVEDVSLPGRFGTNLCAEYLDVTAALAGHGIAIGSPILFSSEIDSGRLVPAHDFVAADGRSFWLTVPVARQRSRKIVKFREWLCEEAAGACAAAEDFIRRAAILDSADSCAARRVAAAQDSQARHARAGIS